MASLRGKSADEIFDVIGTSLQQGRLPKTAALIDKTIAARAVKANIYYTVGRWVTREVLGIRKAEQVAARKAAIHHVAREARKNANSILAHNTVGLTNTLSAGFRQAAGGIKPVVTVDTSNFNRKLKQYLQLSKKSLAEVCNEKAFWIALNAFSFTQAVPREKIKAELLAPSNVAPNAPLAAILANKRRGYTGEKGLQGKKLQAAANKLIRARANSTQFLKAGWIPAIARLGAAINRRGKKKAGRGKPKGGAKPATGYTFMPVASLWNSVQGGKTPKQEVQDILTRAVQQGIDKETASMEAYIEKKLAKAAAQAGMR